MRKLHYSMVIDNVCHWLSREDPLPVDYFKQYVQEAINESDAEDAEIHRFLPVFLKALDHEEWVQKMKDVGLSCHPVTNFTVRGKFIIEMMNPKNVFNQNVEANQS